MPKRGASWRFSKTLLRRTGGAKPEGLRPTRDRDLSIQARKRLLATAPRPEGHSIDCDHPIGVYRSYSRRHHPFVTIVMCYGGIKAGGRIKNAIIIEVPAIPHALVWLNCRGQGYLNDVSIEASLSHYKGISRQCLCGGGCHRAQYESEGGHHDILKPSILFHNLSCFYLVMFSFLVVSD